MFEAEEFKIFGFEHLLTITLIIATSILLPIILKFSSNSTKSNLSILIAAIILINELTTPFYYPALFPFDFPHLHFILFNFSHGLLLFAICFASISLGNKPDFKSFQDTIFYSVPIVLVVYFINILINYSSNDTVANYMYLIEFPLGENLTRFMPDPPFHLFVFLPIAILLFFITYLPFYLKDRFFSQ